MAIGEILRGRLNGHRPRSIGAVGGDGRDGGAGRDGHGGAGHDGHGDAPDNGDAVAQGASWCERRVVSGEGGLADQDSLDRCDFDSLLLSSRGVAHSAASETVDVA